MADDQNSAKLLTNENDENIAQMEEKDNESQAEIENKQLEQQINNNATTSDQHTTTGQTSEKTPSNSDDGNDGNDINKSSTHTARESHINVKEITSRNNFESKAAWISGSVFSGRFKTNYRLNPIVFFASCIIIWGFVIWCLSDDKAYDKISKVQSWIIDSFSWFYIGSVCIISCFIIFLAVHPEYSQICLGKPGERPKYNMITWFSMLFSAGYGVGLYFYGVAESVLHFRDATDGVNRYAYLPTQMQAVSSLNLSWFHWGFPAMSVYCLVGLSVGYLSHRRGFPVTMRSCFYPILGEKIYGFLGDIIDIIAVVATMFGLTTSLGLGVIQLNAGFSRVNSDIEEKSDNQIIIIWCVTILATISVVTGVDKGIKTISQFNFGFGCILILYIFFAGESFFLLNLFVETIGFHFNNILELVSDTDSFEQAGFEEGSSYRAWQASWTVFYWGWWIAWSPFVGIFIAEISRGRTVRQFIIGNMILPTVFLATWMTITGGSGIWLDWKALELGLGTDCSDTKNISDGTYTRLSCQSAQDQLFTLLEFYPLSDLVSVLALIGLAGYFVTSSDSASWVIDLITSNGHEDPPKLQRIFWALTEGAVATVLLSVGGSDALYALQTVSIAAALPFTMVLIIMMYSLYTALSSDKEFVKENYNGNNGAIEMEDYGDNGDGDQSNTADRQNVDYSKFTGEWKVDFFDALVDLKNNWAVSLLALFMPCLLDYLNASAIGLFENKDCGLLWRFAIIVPTITFVVFHIIGAFVDEGFAYLAWVIYVFIALIGCWIRLEIRLKFELKGNACLDVLAHFCCYCFAVSQEAIQCDIKFADI